MMGEAVAEGLGAFAEQARALNERDAATDAMEKLGAAQSEWLKELDTRKTNAEPGAKDFTPTLLKDFDAQAATLVAGAKTRDSRQFLKERMQSLRQSLDRDATTFEATSRIANATDVAKNSIDLARGELQVKPENFSERLGERKALIDAQGLPPKQRALMHDYAVQSLAHDATLGLLDRDPYKTLKLLNKAPGEAGVAAVDALHADDRIRLRDQAEAEIHRREAKAQADADRREGKAERAMNEIDRQIASGVPATADLWAKWEGLVRGTSFAPEFKDRVDSEREIQAMLRKPIDEQITAVQERQAKLDTAGGNLRDAANVQRLATAVQKNITTMQNDPLLYLANRTGQDPGELDITQLESPEGQQQAAGVLRNRIESIQGMRRQYGGQVQMRPLLPQEVRQFSAIVKAASPQQLASVFADLSNALGDPEAYKAVMQQIAPDSPVRAQAGVLASRQAEATLETHWFSPDVKAQSGDVAATVLAGEQIISPGKDASGQDGKPRIGLYLPEVNSLQQQFQNEVGEAFANHPEAAQVALQTAKAYYVGKAAQVGRLASDKTDIDSGILREAITATLGAVVDVNGRGKVIAPWGMGEDRFESRLREEFDANRSRVHWPDGVPLPFDSLGLQSAGANSYYLTAGRTYLVDKQGKPMQIRLLQPGEGSNPNIPENPRPAK